MTVSCGAFVVLGDDVLHLFSNIEIFSLLLSGTNWLVCFTLFVYLF
jgi:hypothetical protein